MNSLEKIAARIRHAPGLNKLTGLWGVVRPFYNGLYAVFAKHGLHRIINGSDAVKLSPALRSFPATYEPETWHQIMQEVRPGDRFVDVGAFVGIYALAIAQRVGETGQVIAFEPDAQNHELLRENVRLNGLEERVRCERKAVGDRDGQAEFLQGKSTESRLMPAGENENVAAASAVPLVRLDTAFPKERVDLLKVDVEGFEEVVLQGARGLLQDVQRRPRAIFVEMHPFNWHISGASSDGLLGLLRGCGNKARSLDGQPVTEIREYGEVIAVPA